MNSLAGSRGPTGQNLLGNRTGNLAGDKIPSGYRTAQLQQFSPDQMQLFQQLFSHVGQDSPLSQIAGGDEAQFKAIEAPALQQFNALQGNLASRFSGMGMGARRSSGFKNASNQASSDFSMQLQSQRQGLQRQALLDLMDISGSLLNQRPALRNLVQKQRKPSFLQSLLGGAAPLAGAAAGSYFGPLGMAAGGSLGSQFGQGLLGQQGNQIDWSGLAGLSNQWS